MPRITTGEIRAFIDTYPAHYSSDGNDIPVTVISDAGLEAEITSLDWEDGTLFINVSVWVDESKE